MSRTFLIEDQAKFNSDTHERQTAVSRAMGQAGWTGDNANPLNLFDYDLIGAIGNLQVQRLKDDVLSRLQFSCDGYISGALSRMLNQFYQSSKTSSDPFPTYGEFLRHIEGLHASESALADMGLDVTPSIERIEALVRLRSILHGMSAARLSDPTTYVVPELIDFLGSPRMKSLSVQAEAGLKAICEDDAGDDIELRDELFEQYRLAEGYERANQHRMDKLKASSLVMIWKCLAIDADAAVGDDEDPFADLDARTQFGLLRTMHRAVIDSRLRVVVDSRIPVMEKAKLRIEAKALIPQLQAQMDHPKFENEQLQ